MKKSILITIGLAIAAQAETDLRIASLSQQGLLSVTNTFTNGICTVESAASIGGAWTPEQNVFSTSREADFSVNMADGMGLLRAVAVDLSGGRAGFSNLVASYSLLTIVAGAGGSTASINKWQPSFEGGPATNALLSRPHIAMADDAGNIYIADKDSHAIRMVTPQGIIVTVAGINGPGDGPDSTTLGTQVALYEPNGLWVRTNGVVYILDLGNSKIRRLTPNGMLSTLFSVPGGILAGRGLWVNNAESLAYVASLTVVKKWTRSEGVTDFASGFTELGNLVVDPNGNLVVTDRSEHRVYRISADGSKTIIAGNGMTSGGGDGQLAVETALNEVRAVWFLPTGAFFVGTHRGSQVWYVDTAGYIHLFLNGSRSDTHAGDGTYFYNPFEMRISEVRAITADRNGNLLITEHDSGYVRKIQFLRHVP